VYFEYICWKFAGCLLDRVNTPRSLLEAHGDKSNGDNEKIKQVEETAHEWTFVYDEAKGDHLQRHTILYINDYFTAIKLSIEQYTVANN